MNNTTHDNYGYPEGGKRVSGGNATAVGNNKIAEAEEREKRAGRSIM